MSTQMGPQKARSVLRRLVEYACWHPWLIVVVFAMVANTDQVNSSINCIRKACDQEESPIVCNQSLILISDVTNWRLERDHMALSDIKRRCMGRESCDLSAVCSKSRGHGTLFVHYSCDANNVFTSSCNGKVLEIPGQHGFIQSPNYPARLPHYMPCRWRIRPPSDSLVVLTLHDVTTSGPRELCDGGLTVSGLACDVLIDHAPQLLCGDDNVTSLVRCGKVDIQLSPSKQVYPLRFWIAFHVHPINQPASFTASVLTCSGWVYSSNAATTEKAPMVSNESDTKVLIILLSIISTISASLIIVLIIVCIRCRLMRITVSDHVYSEPSPALQAHYDYISSLETDKPQPQLVEEYFEVADALPFDLRDTPASPAYAEVEQFIDFKKGQWSSLDSTEWADCQSQYSNTEATGDNASGNDGPSRTKGSRKARESRIKLNKIPGSQRQKNVVKISNCNTEPRVFIVNMENSKHDSSVSEDTSAYEQIEINPCGEGNRVLLRDSKHSPKCYETQNSESRISLDKLKSSPHLVRQTSSPSHTNKSRVDQIKEGLLSKHNEKKDGTSPKKKLMGPIKTSNIRSGDKKATPSNAECRQKLCSNNTGDRNACKTSDFVDEMRTKQNSLLLKERLQTSGIVRNGIQKFEKN